MTIKIPPERVGGSKKSLTHAHAHAATTAAVLEHDPGRVSDTTQCFDELGVVTGITSATHHYLRGHQ